jgi:MOSC domain-containing protein YiiM
MSAKPVGRKGFTVRILQPGSVRPAGLGFVADERHIVTCAHVVNTTMGRHLLTQEKPGSDFWEFLRHRGET